MNQNIRFDYVKNDFIFLFNRHYKPEIAILGNELEWLFYVTFHYSISK